MEIPQLLAILFLFLGLSTASPLTTKSVEKRDRHLSGDQKQRKLDSLHETWKGIYFTDAMEECRSDEFDALLTTLDDTITKFTEPIYVPVEKSPGWNRFFLNDRNAVSSNGWASKKHNQQYKNIVGAMEQARNFPVQGRASRWHLKKPSSRITLRCGPPKSDRNRCHSAGVGAFTLLASRSEEGRADTVHFCTPFFSSKIKSLQQRTDGPKESERGLRALYTKEHLMLHEFFHCDYALGMKDSDGSRFHIDDLSDYVTGYVSKKMIYGADFCASYAWKYTQERSYQRSVNTKVMYNADSYAWLYTFNWFNKHFGWGSDGKYSFNHDDLKRDESSGDDMDFEQGSELTVDGDDIDENQSFPQANCHQIGDDPLNVQCLYLEEEYDDWVELHPEAVSSSTVAASSSAPASSSTPVSSGTPTTGTPATSTEQGAVKCTPAGGAADPEGQQCFCSNNMVTNRNPDGSCDNI